MLFITLVLIGICGEMDARKHKCRKTEASCVASTTKTACSTMASLKNKGESCLMSKECNSNLACDVRKEPPHFICLPVLNEACVTSSDCVNNLNCYSGKCGCPVRNLSI